MLGIHFILKSVQCNLQAGLAYALISVVLLFTKSPKNEL